MTKFDLIFSVVYKPLMQYTVYSFLLQLGKPSCADVITVFRSGELSKILQLTAINDCIVARKVS